MTSIHSAPVGRFFTKLLTSGWSTSDFLQSKESLQRYDVSNRRGECGLLHKMKLVYLKTIHAAPTDFVDIFFLHVMQPNAQIDNMG